MISVYPGALGLRFHRPPAFLTVSHGVNFFLKLFVTCRVFPDMNSNRILLAAALAGGLLSSAVVSSAAVVLSDLTISSTENSAPAPLRIVAPSGISRRYEGATVHLRLTVDESGRPHHITFQSGQDQNLVNHLLPAVAQWKFTPAKKNGRAVAMQIELPVELVDIRTI